MLTVIRKTQVKEMVPQVVTKVHKLKIVVLPFGLRWRRERQLTGSLSILPRVCQMVPERYMAPKNITVERTIQVSIAQGRSSDPQQTHGQGVF
jgi:hypothetical protein